MNILKELQDWFKRNCNGDWEHDFGIKIDTLDNPGWNVEINLTATKLESKDFKEILYNYENDDDWYRCWIENKKWNGVGSPQNLETILKIFLDWAK